jgi:hypothetical protein
MARLSRVGWMAPRVAVLLIVLLAACQPAAAPSSGAPSAAAVATPAASATPAITSTPSATSASSPSARPAALARPTDIPTDGTCEAQRTCLGLLAAGSHHTKTFKPGFSFTMPAAGWENLADEGGDFGLLPIASPGDAIIFFREPNATDPGGNPIFSVGISVAAITKWLPTNTALTVGPMTDVSIGGLKGVQMEITAAPSSVPTVGCEVQTCVTFFKGTDPAAVKAWQWDWGTVSSERQRLDLLTTTDGGVIAIFVDSLDGTTYDDLIKTADTILATVKFDKS